MLLGAAIILSKQKDNLKGTVKFCFQPAEEGGHGAREMINDEKYPVLKNPDVNYCFGLHINPSNEVGTIIT
jgi:metal-dependent amidase/aminoacylase/carboxypeptidase family protein